LAKKKTAAEIELQLSERRFILEAMSSAAEVIQIPIVTAFIWWAMSERSSALRRLNKAIIVAELTPKLGDINFPPGVVLGAAAESLDDIEQIIRDAGAIIPGLIDKTTDTAVQTLFDIVTPASFTCLQFEQKERELRAEVRRAEKLQKYPGESAYLKIKWVAVLKKLKDECPEIYANLGVTGL